MKVIDFLNENATRFEISKHKPAFTAQHVAQEEHISGMNIAKPVIIKADDKFYMCVVPACCKINFDTLKNVLNAETINLADESEMEKLFPDSQVGAEPPFGSLYGIPTIMDDSLQGDEFIVFQDGSHDEAIKMNLTEYLRLENPQISSFSYHMK